ALAQLRTSIEALEQRRKLRLDVSQLKVLLVQQVSAALTIPLEAIALAGTPGALDYESYRISPSLRGVRHERGQQENLTFTDRHIDRAATLRARWLPMVL